MVIHVAQEVPRGTCPLGHGVCLPLGRAATAGAGGIDPIGDSRQGRTTVVRGLVALYLRQEQRKLRFVQSHSAALFAMHDGNGLAPVTLTGEYPVTELEVDLGFANALLSKEFNDSLLSILHAQIVQEAGIDHNAGSAIGKGRFFHIAALDDFDDFTAKLLGKLPVTVVMSGHSHNRARAVGRQNIVGDENGDFPSVDGVNALHALEHHAGLVLGKLGTLEVGLGGGFCLISLHSLGIFQLIHPLGKQSMLGRQNHVGCAEQSIGTSGEDGDIIAQGRAEAHLCAGGATDPVALLRLHTVDEVYLIQIIQQTLSVFGDLQHPLALLLADDGAAATLTGIVHHFFVGQHALTGGTPVDGHLCLISKALLEHLQENPLGPLEIFGIGGVNLSVPIEAVAKSLQLATEIGHIVLGDDGGMDVILNSIVFRGQTECIVAHGEQDIFARHAVLTGNGIHSGIGTGMANMQTHTTGIRELNQSVELLLVRTCDRLVQFFFLPNLLPFGFNCSKIVLHDYFSSKSMGISLASFQRRSRP